MKMRGSGNVNNPEITCISLCSGYEGIGLGSKRVIPNLRTILYSEIERYACEVLVQRMEEGKIDPAPIWTNLKTLPCEQFSGRVDILTGGYPCQPFSAAGKREGCKDPRHLWPWIRSAIKVIKPKICFFENVEGHISLGLKEVLTDLVKLGYSVENECGEPTWGLFSATEVGAPHQRKRVFILATLDDSAGRESIINSMLLRQAERKDNVIRCASPPCAKLANPRNPKLNGMANPERRDKNVPIRDSSVNWGTVPPSADHQWPARPEELQYWWEEPRTLLEDSGGIGRRGRDKNSAEYPRRSSTEDKAERSCGTHDWHGQQGKIKPGLGGTFNGTSGGVDPNKNRIDRLRLLGNGVVPQTAEKAFRVLWGRIVNPDKSKVKPIQMDLFG